MKQGLYWFGAACMVASAWILPDPRGYLVAFTGLGIITVQMIESRTWNLVALNVASMLGYAFTISGSL